ncbi:DUF4193 domain-containing protein [Dactylosporangium darangshiense]|uniref:DUF4193 domain-containing protein n=2 Tax=Dactylosporangium darangshiense TaxID=579108 RepID=A0ABP8CYH7_9ACTN
MRAAHQATRRRTNVDYDAARPSQVEATDDGLDAITSSHAKGRAGNADVDDVAGPVSASDLEPIDEEMSLPVVPMRGDEFRCGRCFLIHHRSRLADDHGVQVCRDCA